MDEVIKYFFEQGLLGVIIVMLIGVVIWQQKKLDTKEKELRVALDARLEDSKSYSLVYNGTVEKYATLTEKTNNNDNLIMQAINGLAELMKSK